MRLHAINVTYSINGIEYSIRKYMGTEEKSNEIFGTYCQLLDDLLKKEVFESVIVESEQVIMAPNETLDQAEHLIIDQVIL